MGLSQLVEKAQNSDDEAMLYIIRCFEPKLKKCSRRLEYEEAETDLIIGLIDAIQSLKLCSIKNNSDGAIINYISNMIENKKQICLENLLKIQKKN